MRVLFIPAACMLVFACGPSATTVSMPPKFLPEAAPGVLRAPGDFSVIADKSDRSRALFVEASRVLLGPRCANCHPNDDSPRQGEFSTLHDPPVTRGPEGTGVVAMQCSSCHQGENAKLAHVPGAPGWRLAPKSMAWIGKSPADICEQLKDPARNGGRTLAQLVEHFEHDALVAWGWAPGEGRAASLGSQAQLAALVSAWIEAGAVCPTPVSPEGAK